MDFAHSNYGINVVVPKNREIIRISSVGGHENVDITTETHQKYSNVNTLKRYRIK